MNTADYNSISLELVHVFHALNTLVLPITLTKAYVFVPQSLPLSAVEVVRVIVYHATVLTTEGHLFYNMFWSSRNTGATRAAANFPVRRRVEEAARDGYISTQNVEKLVALFSSWAGLSCQGMPMKEWLELVNKFICKEIVRNVSDKRIEVVLTSFPDVASDARSITSKLLSLLWEASTNGNEVLGIRKAFVVLIRAMNVNRKQIEEDFTISQHPFDTIATSSSDKVTDENLNCRGATKSFLTKKLSRSTKELSTNKAQAGIKRQKSRVVDMSMLACEVAQNENGGTEADPPRRAMEEITNISGRLSKQIRRR